MADEPEIDLASPRRVHLVGIGGTGISAIGTILATMGHEVTGVDLNETPAWPALIEAGARPQVVPVDQLFAGPDAEGADIVAHSTAFPPSEADRARLAAAGVVVADRAGILRAICAQRPTVAVSGTHGKTSTTAMLATLLEGAGAAPSYLVGAVPLGLGRAAAWTAEGPFVVEADESDGTFLRLDAQVAVVTNIDEDHLDYWGDIDAIEAAFDRFVAAAPYAVVCIDDPRGGPGADPRAMAVAARHGALTVGTSPEARLRVSDVAVHRLDTTFRLALDGRDLGEVRIGTPGRHHACNAAVAIGVATLLGVDERAAIEAIASYRGVTRRFEVQGTVDGVTIVDDYAHNPGKVRALLASAQEAGWDRVVAVFQPHRYTRTRDHVAEFGRALALADVVGICDVYGAGEPPIAGVTGRTLVEAVLDERPWAEVGWVPTLDDASAWARATIREGDLLLTIGAGDVWRVGRSLLEPLP